MDEKDKNGIKIQFSFQSVLFGGSEQFTQMDYFHQYSDYEDHTSNFLLDEIEEDPEYILEEAQWVTARFLIVIIITSASFLANSLVIFLTFKRLSISASVNVFIAFIALSDVFLSCVWMFLPLDEFLELPEKNLVSCKVFFYFLYLGDLLMPLAFTAFLITSVILKDADLKTVVKILTSITVFSAVFTLPYAFYGTVIQIETTEKEKSYCIEGWNEEVSEKIYRIANASIEFLSYSTAVAICVIKFKFFMAESVKIIKMLPMLLLIILILWFPMLLSKFLLIFEHHSIFMNNPLLTMFVFLSFPALFVVKPIFFMIFHTDLRKEVKMLLSCSFSGTREESFALYNN